MAITRKTVIDQIEIRRDGSTQIRFGLLLVEDDAELDCKWHRTAVPADGDINAQIEAVDSHLQSMGHPAIEAADKQRARDVVSAVAALVPNRGRRA
jgi:hypothetical protein